MASLSLSALVDKLTPEAKRALEQAAALASSRNPPQHRNDTLAADASAKRWA